MKKKTRRKYTAEYKRQRARWRRTALCLIFAALFILPAAVSEDTDAGSDCLQEETTLVCMETEAPGADEGGEETPAPEEAEGPETEAANGEEPGETDAGEALAVDAGEPGEESAPGETVETLAALEITADGEVCEDAGQPLELVAGEAETVTFSWTDVGAERYALSIADAEENVAFAAETAEPSLALEADEWRGDAVWTLSVTAVFADGTESGAALRFRVLPADDAEDAEAENGGETAGEADEDDGDAAQPESGSAEPATGETAETETEEDAGADEEADGAEETAGDAGAGSGQSSGKHSSGSGKSSGSRGKGAGKTASGSGKSASRSGGKSKGGKSSEDGTDAEEATGEASGEGLTLTDAPVFTLSLDGEALGISLDGGESPFIATLEAETLALTPADTGEVWTLSATALEALRDCGIGEVALTLEDAVYTVRTSVAIEADEETVTEDSEAAASEKTSSARTEDDMAWVVRAEGISLRAGGLEFAWTTAPVPEE